jgi:hypothetical protein
MVLALGWTQKLGYFLNNIFPDFLCVTILNDLLANRDLTTLKFEPVGILSSISFIESLQRGPSTIPFRAIS